MESHESAEHVRGHRKLRTSDGGPRILERLREQRVVPPGHRTDEHGARAGPGALGSSHRSPAGILAIGLLSARCLHVHRDGHRLAVDLSPLDRPLQSGTRRAAAVAHSLAGRPAILAVVADHHWQLAGCRLQHGPLPGRPREHSVRDARRRGRRRGRRLPAPSPRHHSGALADDAVRVDHLEHPIVSDVRPRQGPDRRRARAQHRGPRLRHMAASVPVLRHRLRLRPGVRGFRDAAGVHGASNAAVRLAGALPVILSGRRRARRLVAPAARTLVLGAGAVVVLTPFVWMLMTSLKPPQEIFIADFRLLPANPTLQNYASVWHGAAIPRYLLNSFVVAFLILVSQLATITPAAYAFAKLKFAGRDVCFYLVLGMMMIPAHITMIPNFVTVHRLGWLDTYWGLAAPFLTSGFGVFLLRQFFLTIPDSLIDAARIDGAGSWRVMWQIMVPLAWPALLAFAIFSFATHWNDYFWPLLVVRTKTMQTIPLALASFQNQEAGTLWGELMAAAVIGVVPLLAFFLVVQRRFVEGITLPGLKG